MATPHEPAARTYTVRTFGCQMNEHDSERIAGLLEADGLTPADDVDDADVVVLNTCCIRENADNKLYGTLGHLKPLQGRQRPTLADRGGRAAWPRRTATWSGARRRHVDVVFGTHNVHRAVELLHEAARSAARHRDPDEATVLDDHELFPSALPARRETAYNAWVTIQIGCDNTLRLLHRAGGARPRDQPPVRRHRRRGRAAGRRRRHRGHAARPERQLLRARPHACAQRQRRRATAPRPAAVRRPAAAPSAASTASAGSATPAPTPRTCAPDTIAAMAETPAVCEHLHLPAAVRQRPRAGGDAPRLHRRALPRAARRGPRRHRRPGRHHRHHRRLPRRDRRRLRRAPSRWSPPPSTTAPTPSSSRRARAPRRPSWPTASSTRPSSPSASSACGSSSSARRLAKHRGPDRVGSRRSLVEGPSQAGRRAHVGPHPAEQAGALRGPEPLRAGTYAAVEITGAGPALPARRAARGHRGRVPPHPHPRRLGLSRAPE